MKAKTVLLICAQAFLAHATYAQCLGNAINPGLGLNYGIGAGNQIGLGNQIGFGCNGLGSGLNSASANGGGFTVTSSSPIAPSGVSVVSEYLIEGPVEVGGQLPVLAVVSLEGQLPSGGNAGVSYSCGNGNVGIANEIGNSVGLGAANLGAGLGSNLGAGLGANLGAGLGGNGLNRLGGCGCGF